VNGHIGEYAERDIKLQKGKKERRPIRPPFSFYMKLKIY
jgi:hypothetical protein